MPNISTVSARSCDFATSVVISVQLVCQLRAGECMFYMYMYDCKTLSREAFIST